jgi:hypothetical protein
MVLGKLLADSINSVSQTHRNCTLYKLLTIYKQQQLIVGQMKGEMGSAMDGTTEINFFKSSVRKCYGVLCAPHAKH